MDQIIVYGAGGHAKVVIDAIECAYPGCTIVLIDDDSSKAGHVVAGYQVQGDLSRLTAGKGEYPSKAIVAIGHNRARLLAHQRLQSLGLNIVSIVHPAAVIAKSTRLGSGSFLAAGAIVNPDCRVGEAVIINTAATVDHDCVLGAAVHIAPGAHLCGGVVVGEGALVGVGASVLPGVSIGEWAVVGAGAVVTRDVPSRTCVVGVPARMLRKEIYD